MQSTCFCQWEVFTPVAQICVLWELKNSYKAFSASCCLWKCFHCKNCWDGWEMEVTWQGVRWIWQMRQNFVAQFVKLLKCWLYSCLGEELDPFCWPMVTAGIAVFCISLICWTYFSDVMVLWNSENYSRSDWQQITKQGQWPFFWCSLALGSAFELLLSPTTELASHCQLLYKIHFCGASQPQRILFLVA